MQLVNDSSVSIILTGKHRAPIEKESVRLFGLQQHSVIIKGDIVSPIQEEWDANP